MSEEAPTSVPLPSQLAAAYKQLAASAQSLNSATDEFMQAIEPVDSALAKLRIGIECWVRIKNFEDPDGSYRRHELGYARIAGKWGIALRVVDGDPRSPFNDSIEQWLYGDAPRHLRLDGIEKLPALLERLIQKANNAVKKVKETTETARQFAAAVQEAAAEVAPKKKGLIVKKTAGGE